MYFDFPTGVQSKLVYPHDIESDSPITDMN